MAGDVTVGEQITDKPGTRVALDAILTVREQERYVSRGGVKLAAALHAFTPPVAGATCLDIGASTGGFTDCLLQHGAARVYAIDVGHSQLAWKIRNDPRVIVREKINARYLEKGDFFKLRNATFMYAFGNVGKYFKNLNAFVTGANLFVITKFTGFDPEVNIDKNQNNYPSRSIEFVPYPTPRTITFGINVGL